MFRQTPIRTGAGIALIAGLAIHASRGGYFDREIVIEIAILAMLAISLDIVAGFGRMISLCHGAIFGLAAYGYGTAIVKFGLPPSTGLVIGIALAIAFGALVGAICAGTVGIFYIMATLAFGQIAYVLIFESRWLGGDDGMTGVRRMDLSLIGLNMRDSLTFALVCLAVLMLVYIAAAIVLRSSFGRTLSGIHANEARMRAVGINTRMHKTAAFAFSAALAGIAGVLKAQHTMFVSPELLFWTLSGEVLIIVILGGIGTLIGPAIGATLLVLLKHEVSHYTVYWHVVVGAVLILAVLAGGRGLFGEFEYRLARWRARRRARRGTGGAADA